MEETYLGHPLRDGKERQVTDISTEMMQNLGQMTELRQWKLIIIGTSSILNVKKFVHSQKI